ncbi:MAG: AAA family ATPase [Lactobacillales bacterium]|nr:AAA family ATPase [Lactobacillales bacterium]
MFEKEYRMKQPQVFSVLERMISRQHLTHAYLFVGKAGVGKHALAKWLAKAKFCESTDESNLPCLKCNFCVRIEKDIYPDVITIKTDSQTIKVEQIRSLKKELSFSGFESCQKMIIIQEADKMNANSQNSLLKFLEEPNENVTIVLETTEISKLLPTIVSRVQPLFFRPLKDIELKIQLLKYDITEEEADFLTNLGSNMKQAVCLLQKEEFQNYRKLVQNWIQLLRDKESIAFIYVDSKLVPSVKERINQKLVLEMLRVFWQNKRAEYFRKKNESVYVKGLEKIMVAIRKFESNVSFQNVCEQLALRFISS